MRFVLCALLLAAPALAQAHPDRDAVLAAARKAVTADTNVTSIAIPDTATKFSGATIHFLHRETKYPIQASLDVLRIRGDSAYVMVQRMTMIPHPFSQRSWMLLVRRGGGWVVTKEELVAIS